MSHCKTRKRRRLGAIEKQYFNFESNGKPARARFWKKRICRKDWLESRYELWSRDYQLLSTVCNEFDNFLHGFDFFYAKRELSQFMFRAIREELHRTVSLNYTIKRKRLRKVNRNN